MGLNSTQVGDGNITNVVIKSRYSLLELKCNKAEIQLKKLLKKIIKVVIEEINKNNSWDYTLNDIYIDFEREILTNATDNAQIAQIEAATKQTEINTLLNLDTFIDRELINQQIAEILDFEYEEIKEYFKDEESPEKELDETMKNVENIPAENMV